MKLLWDIKVYEMTSVGFRVVLKSGEKTATGNGPSVAQAFTNAEVQFVRKPPFVPFK